MAIKIYNKGGSVVIEDGTEYIQSIFSYYAEGDNITVIDRISDNFVWNLKYDGFLNEAGTAIGSSASAVLDYLGSLTTTEVAIIDYNTEVALGKIADSSIVNKFGYNLDIDTADGEDLIASFGGANWNPLTEVITTAQTFTIAYNNTTDGSGQIGATLLQISYIDENSEAQTAIHVMSTTGSDVTSFSGLGINRAVCVAFGSSGSNINDITITATTDGTTQAQIPAGKSVTQQCIYHTPINHTLLIDFLNISALKTSGGGSKPELIIHGYSYSRVTSGVYEVINIGVDVNVENNLTINFVNPITFTGREVIFFTAESDIDNARVSVRFSGIETLS